MKHKPLANYLNVSHENSRDYLHVTPTLPTSWPTLGQGSTVSQRVTLEKGVEGQLGVEVGGDNHSRETSSLMGWLKKEPVPHLLVKLREGWNTGTKLKRNINYLML